MICVVWYDLDLETPFKVTAYLKAIWGSSISQFRPSERIYGPDKDFFTKFCYDSNLRSRFWFMGLCTSFTQWYTLGKFEPDWAKRVRRYARNKWSPADKWTGDRHTDYYRSSTEQSPKNLNIRPASNTLTGSQLWHCHNE